MLSTFTLMRCAFPPFSLLIPPFLTMTHFDKILDVVRPDAI